MFENIAGCAMLIISLRYLFKLLSTNDPRDYLLAGLFLGLALFIRPEYILFAIPLFIILLLNRSNIRQGYACLSLFPFIVAIGPFFILNNSLYGSFLTTGQHLSYGVSQPIPVGSFSMINILKNSVNLIILTPLPFLFSLFGLLSCGRKKINLYYMLFFIISSLTLSFYFLSGRVSPINIHSSYVRYLLPLYLLSLPFISYFILSFKRKFIIIPLIFAILVTSILTVLPAIDSNQESCEDYARVNNEVVDTTEPDAIIFLDYWDKAIFPERKVGLIKELPEENRCGILCAILIDLSERNIPAYVLIEERFVDFIDYDAFVEELSARGYTLSETEKEALYKVSRKV
jgi:hypothetical protein